MTATLPAPPPLGVFHVVISNGASHGVAQLRGELDLATAPPLEQLLDQLRGDGHRQITLDLAGLEFLGAAGLRVFVRADQALRAAGGRLVLTRPNRTTRHILAVTGLDSTMAIE